MIREPKPIEEIPGSRPGSPVPVGIAKSVPLLNPASSTMPLYRRQEVLDAAVWGGEVWVAGGEKDADALASLGLCSTSLPGSADWAQPTPWTDVHTETIRGAKVILVANRDEVGRRFARDVLAKLNGTVEIDCIIEVPDVGSKPCKTPADFLAAGGTVAELRSLSVRAGQLGPCTLTEPISEDRSEVLRLAAIPPMAYDRERKQAAKKLGIRADTLDKLVEEARQKEDDEQGDEIEYDEPEAWTEPVEGPELLEAILRLLTRHLVLPDGAADALSLWIVHTWTWEESSDYSPLVHIHAPVEACGKSLVGEVCMKLVRRGTKTSNATTAAVFRLIAGWRPSLFFDEIDNMSDDDKRAEFLAIINDGYHRGGCVLRTVGEDHTVRKFSVFGPKMLIGIGKILPPTTRSRAIAIAMRRKRPGEAVERFRETGSLPEASDIQRRIVRWGEDHAESLGSVKAAPLDGISDRHNDVWEPLFVLADLVGGDWPARARASALTLCGKGPSGSDENGNERLLRDIRAVFAKGVVEVIEGTSVPAFPDQLPSVLLCESLRALEDAPWGEFDRGRGLKPVRLAKLLSDYDIHSRDIKFDGKTLKGYALVDFRDAFSRYLVDSEDSKRDAATSIGTEGVSQVLGRATDIAGRVYKNQVFANRGAGGSGVAFQESNLEHEDSFGKCDEVEPPQRNPSLHLNDSRTYRTGIPD